MVIVHGSGAAARRRATVVLTVAVLVVGVLGLVPGAVSGGAGTAGARPLAVSGGSFRAVTPARVLDTRSHNGGSRVAARGSLHLLVLGRGGVPASHVTAVLLSLVVTRPAAGGYVTAYADGSARPRTSNVNFRAGSTVSDHVTVRVGANGRVAFYNGSAGAVDLVADVYGYVSGPAPIGAGSFVASSPTRLVDTRTSTPPSLAAGASLRVPVAGHGGVAGSGVAAVAVTVTAVGPRAAGSLNVHAAGATAAPQATTSFAAGVTTAGATVATLGTGGALEIGNDSAGTTAVLVDVVGYFVSGAAGPTGMYVPVPPTRLHVDSPVPARASTSITVSSSHGIVPDQTPMALVLAVTATAGTGGYLTPTASSIHDSPVRTSALNLRAGSVSGIVIAREETDVITSAALYNGAYSSVDVQVTVLGYFVAAPGGAAVSGHVTDASSGAGVAGVVVRLYNPDPDMADEFGQIYGTATTDAHGTYTVAGVQNGGDYMVCFDPRNALNSPPHTVYGRQCWKDLPSRAGFPPDPTVVHTTVGSTTSGIDAALTSMTGGSISGAVTDADGRPVAGVHVASDDGVATATDAHGDYHLDGIPAGANAVHVAPGSVTGPQAPYGYLAADSGAVTVHAGADTPGVDVHLAALSRIVGHVHTSTGATLGRGHVVVFGPGGHQYSADIDTVDGSYVVTGFIGGTYTVCFHGERPDSGRSPAYNWADQCFDHVAWPSAFSSPAAATPVTVAGGAQRTVDATLQPAGAISGTVRTASGAGVDGAQVDVFDPVTHTLLREVQTGGNGSYLVGNGLVPTASGYTVCADGAPNLGSICYRNVAWPGPGLPDGTAPVTVPSDAVHSGIDLVLPPRHA